MSSEESAMAALARAGETLASRTPPVITWKITTPGGKADTTAKEEALRGALDNMLSSPPSIGGKLTIERAS